MEENSGKLIRFLQINDLSKTGHRMWMSFGGLIMCTLVVLLHLSHFTEVEVPSENICASPAWADGNLAESDGLLGNMVEHPNQSQPNPVTNHHPQPV